MGLVDMLLKKFDDEDTIIFGEKNFYRKDSVWAHSGSPLLDFNLKVLGFPVGVTEISGLSKSGKTTLALEGLKSFQKQYKDGVGLMLSSESRDNKEYAENIGVRTKDVLVIKAKFVEDLFFKLQIRIDQICDLWQKNNLPGKPKIYVIWDSIGATNSRAELETFKNNVASYKKHIEKGKAFELKHARMGDFATAAKRCMKAMLSQLYEKDIIFVALNHRYDKMGLMEHGTQSTGGKWVEFLPTLRLETVRVGWERMDEVEVGQYTKVKVEKNDFGSRKATEIEILLGQGLVLTEEDIIFAADKGILQKKNEKTFSFSKGLVWNSKRTFYENYSKRNVLLNVLHSQIKKARHEDILAEKEIKK